MKITAECSIDTIIRELSRRNTRGDDEEAAVLSNILSRMLRFFDTVQDASQALKEFSEHQPTL